MIDWKKLENLKIESEEDIPEALNTLVKSLPNEWLDKFIWKCKMRGEYVLQAYLEDEKRKRQKSPL